MAATAAMAGAVDAVKFRAAADRDTEEFAMVWISF